VISAQILSNPHPHYGYDAAMDEYKDLVVHGIIDPTKVERCALENAISVAGMFLTTEALIVENPKPEKDVPTPPGGGMGGMY
jgi:chaperonin GroEL